MNRASCHYQNEPHDSLTNHKAEINIITGNWLFTVRFTTRVNMAGVDNTGLVNPLAIPVMAEGSFHVFSYLRVILLSQTMVMWVARLR